MTSQLITPPPEFSLSIKPNVRKRVRTACERCKMKKVRCDETTPCSRCETDNTICIFGPPTKIRDRIYPRRYVELLEQEQAHLVIGLQELYKQVRDSSLWLGSPLDETSDGTPLTHDILKRLGVFELDEHRCSETCEELPALTQQRLIAGVPSSLQRQDLPGCGSDSSNCTTSEDVASKPSSEHFGVNDFPPTPPNQSTSPQTLPTPMQIEAQTCIQSAPMQSSPPWYDPLFGYDDNTDPCLAIAGWNEDDDFQNFQSTFSMTSAPSAYSSERCHT